MVALLAARDRAAKEHGNLDKSRLVAYTSDQVS